jgi:hypothetical protein
MATVVNSKKEKLPLHEIVMTSIKENAPDGATPKGMARSINSLLTGAMQKDLKVKQIGNTVFFHSEQTKDGVTIAQGTLYNLDPAQNMLANVQEYGKHLRKRGVNYYTVAAANDKYLPLAKAATRKLSSEGFATRFIKPKTKGGAHVFVVRLDNAKGKQNGD